MTGVAAGMMGVGDGRDGSGPLDGSGTKLVHGGGRRALWSIGISRRAGVGTAGMELGPG